MRYFRFVPDQTNIQFMRGRHVAFFISLILIIGSVVAFAVKGLNYGIDFRGGILIEVKTPLGTSVAEMRDSLGTLGLGEVSLQEFGAPDDILIRIER